MIVDRRTAWLAVAAIVIGLALSGAYVFARTSSSTRREDEQIGEGVAF